MADTRRPWNRRERTMVADWLRLKMTCSAIGREFGLSKKEAVRRIVADPELKALRPRLTGLNPNQRRYHPEKKDVPETPPRSIIAETPLQERPAKRGDPMFAYKDPPVLVDMPLPPMPVIPISGMRLVALPELERGECRWPVADRADVVGGVLFCGKVASGSYCAAHAFAALPPMQQRRMGAVGPRPRENESNSRLARGLNFHG